MSLGPRVASLHFPTCSQETLLWKKKAPLSPHSDVQLSSWHHSLPFPLARSICPVQAVDGVSGVAETVYGQLNLWYRWSIPSCKVYLSGASCWWGLRCGWDCARATKPLVPMIYRWDLMSVPLQFSSLLKYCTIYIVWLLSGSSI